RDPAERQCDLDIVGQAARRKLSGRGRPRYFPSRQNGDLPAAVVVLSMQYLAFCNQHLDRFTPARR
ncbi:hypothetical protein, partial [Klebsiella aerogenes]